MLLGGFGASLKDVFPVVVTTEVKHFSVERHATAEVLEVLVLLLCPTSFGDSHQSRQGQILEILIVGYPFAPECGLDTRVERL